MTAHNTFISSHILVYIGIHACIFVRTEEKDDRLTNAWLFGCLNVCNVDWINICMSVLSSCCLLFLLLSSLLLLLLLLLLIFNSFQRFQERSILFLTESKSPKFSILNVQRFELVETSRNVTMQLTVLDQQKLRWNAFCPYFTTRAIDNWNYYFKALT